MKRGDMEKALNKIYKEDKQPPNSFVVSKDQLIMYMSSIIRELDKDGKYIMFYPDNI